MADPAVASKRFRTHNVDTVTNHFKFAVGAAGAVGTLSQGNGAAVTSVTLTSSTGDGLYTVQLAKPYPASLIDVTCNIAVVGVTSNAVRAALKAATFSATAGTFVIATSIPTDSTHSTMIAGDPVSGSEIMVSYTYLE
jgi:hypothetical protein